MSYDFKPGRLGAVQSSWPLETSLARNHEKNTVLAFLHPRCVCTRATVKQLFTTLKAHPDAELIALFFTPLDPKDSEAWQESEYVKTLRMELPGARIFFDRGGIEASRFGAFTSGTILVYDRQGTEIFSGGITDRRGGEQDNAGLKSFARALNGERLRTRDGIPTPVFGCPLVTGKGNALWRPR